MFYIKIIKFIYKLSFLSNKMGNPEELKKFVEGLGNQLLQYQLISDTYLYTPKILSTIGNEKSFMDIKSMLAEAEDSIFNNYLEVLGLEGELAKYHLAPYLKLTIGEIENRYKGLENLLFTSREIATIETMRREKVYTHLTSVIQTELHQLTNLDVLQDVMIHFVKLAGFEHIYSEDRVRNYVKSARDATQLFSIIAPTLFSRLEEKSKYNPQISSSYKN